MLQVREQKNILKKKTVFYCSLQNFNYNPVQCKWNNFLFSLLIRKVGSIPQQTQQQQTQSNIGSISVVPTVAQVSGINVATLSGPPPPQSIAEVG